ncbi:MAG: glycoside hydrolase family 16 protein [Silvibacterium sp.]|nr:glycoside hydrolase family 16 protein [Silvibacterium sp.]
MKWIRQTSYMLISCGIAACGAGSMQAGGNSTSVTQETLIWSDEFTGTAESAPNPANWTYDTGAGGWGNNELETYCGYGSNSRPCNPRNPNTYVGGDGYLHIVARQPSPGVYTSARLKSQGLQSFKYGRIEASIRMPKGQGMWPAFWMLGDNIASVGWPSCGEMDIMESIGSKPSTNYGSIHGTGFTGTLLGAPDDLPNGTKFGDAFHSFGILWSPQLIKFYVDNPANVYATYTPSSLPKDAVWPFDGQKFFFILNVAVGGSWPGSPDSTTVFPQEMLVDYVRVYAEPRLPA